MLEPQNNNIAMYRPGYVERTIHALPFGLAARLSPVFSGGNLKARSMRGAALTLAGFGGSQVLRLGSNLILTRLLAPEAFGLMALVNVFLQGLEMLSDLGVYASIIQSERGDDPVFLRTAWTLGVIRGFLLWLFACAIAWPASVFYEEPVLAYMLPVSGLCTLISGLQTTAIAQYNRHMKLGALTCLQLLTQAITLFGVIFLAWQIRSVWALVLGGVIGAGANVLLSFWLLSGVKHHFTLDRICMTEIVRFGKWLFLATAFAFLAGQSDRLILAKLVGPATLGIYSIAFMLTAAVAATFSRLNSAVVYPLFSQYAREEPARFSQRFEQTRRLTTQGMMGLSLLVASVAPLFFETLYDDRYREAGWMTQLLLLPTWIDGLNCSLNAALLAMGASFASALMNAAKLLVSTVCVIAGFYLAGIPGLIMGVAAGHLVANLILHSLLAQFGIRVWRQDLEFCLLFVIGGSLVGLMCHASKFALLGPHAEVIAAVSGTGLVAIGGMLAYSAWQRIHSIGARNI
ncbi:MAG TPA: oligosaccharide flippase family protein [Planctomycetaceae bacterium]|nr:oligosaccharide flippase family protein [Planctomycetaceae bacterium]